MNYGNIEATPPDDTFTLLGARVKKPDVSTEVIKRPPITRSFGYSKHSPTCRRLYFPMLFTPLERPTLPQEAFHERINLCAITIFHAATSIGSLE